MDLISNFLNSLFNMYMDMLADTLLNTGFETVFFIEKQMGMPANFLSNVELVILAFAVVLLSCKLLFKLFNIYILGVDGDSSVSPIEYLKSYAKGIILSICFTTLYGWIGDVCTDFVAQINKAIGAEVEFKVAEAANMLYSIFLLVFMIVSVTLYINCLMMGVRLLFLRISIPLSCVGLIDNDNGIYATFMKKLMQTVITIIAQLSLMRISLMPMMISANIIPCLLSIAIAMYGHKITADLNDIFLATPATGAGQKISSIGRGAQVLTSLVGRR